MDTVHGGGGDEIGMMAAALTAEERHKAVEGELQSHGCPWIKKIFRGIRSLVEHGGNGEAEEDASSVKSGRCCRRHDVIKP